MRYKTIIKITCDAPDKEEALHKAGEFLKGGLDEDLSMTLQTRNIFLYNLMKFIFAGITFFVIISFSIIAVTKVECSEMTKGITLEGR